MKNVVTLLVISACVWSCKTTAPNNEKTNADASAETKRATKKDRPAASQPATPSLSSDQKKAASTFLKHAQSSKDVAAKDTRLPVRQVDEDHIAVGQFLVNRKQGWIKIQSKVNQNEEILEYLSCGPRGKLHECVLLSYGLPMHLHVALILLGAEPGGEYGTELLIDVEWIHPETGEIKRHSAAKFLYDRLNLRAGQDIVWSFVGSRYMDGRYAANDTQSLVAVINDSEAVIGIKNIVGNAHKGPNQGFEGNKETTPPPGTAVDLYIKVPK